jgi:hypothetical protein
MKAELTTWERERLMRLLAGVRNASLATVRKGMKAWDALELSDEEKEEVGYQQHPQGGARWQDTEREFEVEIKDREAAGLVVRLLKTHVREKNEQEDWSMNDALLLGLCKKLDVDPDELMPEPETEDEPKDAS